MISGFALLPPVHRLAQHESDATLELASLISGAATRPELYPGGIEAMRTRWGSKP